MEATRQFRGISKRLAVQYLENLGGEHSGDTGEAIGNGAGGGDRDGDGDGNGNGEGDEATTHVEGDGWTATLDAETVSAAGSIELTEVTVEFEGERDALEPLIEDFERKAIRAGG